MILILIFIFILVNQSICSYTVSSSTSQCVTIENSSDYKWCRFYTFYTTNYYCLTTDPKIQSGAIGDESYYRCSTETDYLPQNSKYLLCPLSNADCNTQELTLATDTSSVATSSNFFSTSTICWYKFTPSSTTTKSIRVFMTSLSNAKSEVYVETSTNTYSYKGSVSAGTSLNTTIGTSNAVWVLISPTSSNAYAYITTTASPYENSSSTTLSDNAIAAIVICSVLGCFIFLFIFGLIVGCHIAKNKRSKQRNNSSAQYADNRTPAVNNYMYQYQTANNGYSPYTQNGSNQYQNSAPYKGQQMDLNPNNHQAYSHGYPVGSQPVYSNGNAEAPSNKV